jgi:N-acetyl-alpha-D-muramate 1-phosphate uridylyltransferase
LPYPTYVYRGIAFMKALILASGKGTRMRPLTQTLPKPLVKLWGRSLIEHHLEHLRAAGITEVVINIAYLKHMIREAIGDGSRFGVKVVYSDEIEPLESGGCIYHALPLLGDKPFLVLNADMWTDYPLSNFINTSLAGMGHIVLVNNPEDNVKGDYSIDNGLMIKKAGNNDFTVSGIAVYDPQFFAHCRPGIFSIVPMWNQALSQGLISAEYYSGLWYPIGTVQQLAQAQALNLTLI